MTAIVYEIVNKRRWYTGLQECIRNLCTPPYLYIKIISYKDALRDLKIMSDKVDTIDGITSCGLELAGEVRDMYVEYHNEYDRLKSAIETYRYEMKVS